MTGKPRLLRVLLIDDVGYSGSGSLSVRTLGTRDLSVLEFRSFRPTTVTRAEQLRSWEDHLEFWRQHDHGLPWPELVLVDCHFDRDETSPTLGTDSAGDPRGLLHGVVQVARMRGINPRFPFSFAVYSQDLPALVENPYAVTLFGLLQAMSGQLEGFDHEVSVTEKLRIAMADHHRGGTPRRAWSSALQDFRVRLAEAFEDGVFAPDLNSWHRAAEALRGFVDGEVDHIPDEQALAWSGPWEDRDTVLLRSLFADRRREDRWVRESVRSEDIEWITNVTSIELQQDLIRVVYTWMDGYRDLSDTGGGSWSKIAGLPRGLTYDGYGLGLTLLWAVEWVGDQPILTKRTPSAIETAMCFVPGEATRAVTKIHYGSKNKTLQPFLGRLEAVDGPAQLRHLKSWVRDAVRGYLRSRFPGRPYPPAFS